MIDSFACEFFKIASGAKHVKKKCKTCKKYLYSRYKYFSDIDAST